MPSLLRAKQTPEMSLGNTKKSINREAKMLSLKDQMEYYAELSVYVREQWTHAWMKRQLQKEDSDE